MISDIDFFPLVGGPVDRLSILYIGTKYLFVNPHTQIKVIFLAII